MRHIQIQWDAESVQHIWQHQVHPEEIEEVLQGRYLLERGRKTRYYILGKSESGRHLFIVLARRRSGRYMLERIIAPKGG